MCIDSKCEEADAEPRLKEIVRVREQEESKQVYIGPGSTLIYEATSETDPLVKA